VPQEYRDSRSLPEMMVPEGSYFMMGDHRSISSDSREFGPVERGLITARQFLSTGRRATRAWCARLPVVYVLI